VLLRLTFKGKPKHAKVHGNFVTKRKSFSISRWICSTYLMISFQDYLSTEISQNIAFQWKLLICYWCFLLAFFICLARKENFTSIVFTFLLQWIQSLQFNCYLVIVFFICGISSSKSSHLKKILNNLVKDPILNWFKKKGSNQKRARKMCIPHQNYQA
jgi:hypothetical protein